jgi:hypothetical protein
LKVADSTIRPTRLVVKAAAGNGMEDDEVPLANNLISSNPQFASVFQSALKRGGRAALTQNAAPAEPKPSPAEEVLMHALRQSRRTINRLEQAQRELEEALIQENRQFERIQFGLRRATADAAFIRTLQKLRAERRAQDGDE